jgi:hypothetical protein
MRLFKIRNCNNIGKKSGKKREGSCSLLVMMLGGAVFRVQCAFQILKLRLCQMKNSDKMEGKIRIKIGTVVSIVGCCCQGAVYMSKKGK